MIAVFVDLHHARVEMVQFLLDGGAAPFRLDDQAAWRGRRRAAISLSATLRFSTRVHRQVHLGHALAEAANDFVTSDASGCDSSAYPRMRRTAHSNMPSSSP